MQASLRVCVLAAALLIVGTVGFIIGKRTHRDATTAVGDASGTPVRQPGNAVSMLPVSSPSPIDAALVALARKESKESRQRAVQELRDALLTMPAEKAVAEMLAFLATGRNESTGEVFKLGLNGMIDSSPSLRTLLLDLLGRLDARAAAKQAAQLLERPTTADEWAVGLRNYVWGTDPEEAQDFLRRKALELIQNPAWRSAPSGGYFEAFDVLVHTRAVGSVPLLSDMTMDLERKDLAYAAFLTLDRLTMREPQAVLSALVEAPALAAKRPEMVAGLFARADVGDAAQRKILETYLLSPDRSEKEWQAFAGVYPNANSLVSQNLLTSAEDSPALSLRQRDRSALAWTEALLHDARFMPHEAELRRIQQRLSQFVNSSKP